VLDQLRRTDLALRAGIKLLGLGFMVIAGCGESSGSTSVTLSGRATELLTAANSRCLTSRRASARCSWPGNPESTISSET